MSRFMVFLGLLLSITSSFTANHYVRRGAGGNGSDWTNAYGNLPAVLVRGDTYYVADGGYGSYAFDDAGTALITIKKATVTDHGTDTGWDDAYGDGQAIWTYFNFSRRYYEINGQTGSGKSGYGIALSNPAFDATLVRLEANVSNITFKYMDIKAHWDPASHDEAGKRNCLIWGGSGASNITVSHCYLHDVNWYTALQMGSWNTFLLEYSYLENVFNKEALAARDCNNAVVRHNTFENVTGTGIIIFKDVSNWEIYSNVFFNSDPRFGAINDAVIGVWTSKGYFTNNMKIHNNSFVNLGPNAGNGAFALSGTGIEIYNNIWYHCEARGFGFAGTHDYNWFYDNTDPRLPGQTDDAALAGAEAHGTVGTGDPFVNWQSGDFQLKAPLGPGKVLASPYNVDRNGLTRGDDGVWDRGAFEYSTTNIERRTPNVERRMPRHPTHSIGILMYDLGGREVLPQQTDRTGVYLVADENSIFKVVKLK